MNLALQKTPLDGGERVREVGDAWGTPEMNSLSTGLPRFPSVKTMDRNQSLGLGWLM